MPRIVKFAFAEFDKYIILYMCIKFNDILELAFYEIGLLSSKKLMKKTNTQTELIKLTQLFS